MTSLAINNSENEQSLIQSFCDAVSADLSMLATLNGSELTEKLMKQLKQINFPLNFGFVASDPKTKSSLTTLNLSISNWPEKMSRDDKDILDMDFASIYLNHSYRASPEESVWIDEENLAMQQSMFDVREYYKRYGLEAENWRVRPDDHLVTQLQFIAYVFSTEASMDSITDISNFLDEHLLRWAVSFSERAAVRCETSFYASLLLVTAYYLEELRDLIALILDRPRPGPEDIDKRMQPVSESIIQPMQYVPGTSESW